MAEGGSNILDYLLWLLCGLRIALLDFVICFLTVHSVF